MKKVKATIRSLKNRWLVFLATIFTLASVSVVNASSSTAAPIGSMPTKACIPSNNLLSKYVKKPIGDMAGALGGILPAIVGLMVVIAALLVIARILSKNGKDAMVKLVLVIAVLPGIAVLLIIGYAFWAMLKSACPGSL